MRWGVMAAIGALALLVPLALGTARAEGGGRRPRTHVVERGETLGSIAEAAGVTVDDVAAANKIRPDRPLSVGQKLALPRPGGPHYHVVRPGETVAQIATSARCPAAEILRRNELPPSARLDVGQVLVLPDCSGAEGGARREAPPAARTHRVKAGEQVREIAKRYGVTRKALMRANGIRDARSLREGQELVIPEGVGSGGRPLGARTRVSGRRVGGGVEHWVVEGQTWRTLAAAYGVPVAKLREANGKARDRLRPGDVVRIPGARKAVPVPVGNCGYPGIPFVKQDRRVTIRVLDCKGRVSKAGRRRLSTLAKGRGADRTFLLHPRLLRMLQRVADEYPGRPFHVVSGYRPPDGAPRESRHHHGQAFDFSVEGVPNKTLHSFCRTLPSTGCGFYPHSPFVHLDVRDESATWIDYSGPGEEPDYAPRGEGSSDRGAEHGEAGAPTEASAPEDVAAAEEPSADP